MPAPPLCTITGTAYLPSGGVQTNAYLNIVKVYLDNAVLTSELQIVNSTNGVFNFTLPRGSIVYLFGNVIGLHTSSNGHARPVPDAPTATLESLLPASTHTVNGVTQGQLADLQERVDALETGGASYLVYTAKLSQAGAGDPTATVLENTLGGAIVWARAGVGAYTGTLNGAFPVARSWFAKPSIDYSAADGVEFHAFLNRGSDNIIALTVTDVTGLAMDGFNNLSIEIRVYPA